MKIRGRFTVDYDPEKVFEVLAGACGELKAKMQDIDTLRHRIDGKSKTTPWRWGTRFHARVIKYSPATMVEVYDIALATDDRFIKELYRTFTKYQPASPLEIDFVEQIDNVKSGVDGHLDDRPLPAEGQSLIEADMPDAAGWKPVSITCRQCGTSNPLGNEYCNKCGLSLAGCPSCGQAPGEGMTFCTRCGTKLD